MSNSNELLVESYDSTITKRIKLDADKNLRFIGILDQLDARVERLRKEALQLQEKRDLLLLSMDLLKNNELLSTLSENEREEIECYAKRVASRLHTVELNVRTVRDSAQEDHLHQINVFIDGLISHPDPLSSRQKCQQFLYSCGFFDVTPAKEDDNADKGGSTSTDIPDILPIDKKFESALLGCTLDDQKIVRKRLQALLNYLIKQSISD